MKICCKSSSKYLAKENVAECVLKGSKLGVEQWMEDLSSLSIWLIIRKEAWDV